MAARFHFWTPMLLGTVLAAGCIRKDYPEDLEYFFTPHPEKSTVEGKETKIYFDVEPEIRRQLAEKLKPVFGTPAHPIVDVDAEIQNDPELQLQPERLKRGSLVYRNLCLTCHGLVGDGSGPTGYYLDPKPRDFRKGFFKFRSTEPEARAPSRSDLQKTLRNGVPHAQMPSFGMLGEEDLDDVISYVIHLSLRGRTERLAAQEWDSEPDVAETAATFAKAWRDEAKKTYKPPEPQGGWQVFYEAAAKEDFKKGRALYLGDGACSECHGKGVRPSPFEPDLKKGNSERLNEWGDLNPPRELTWGYYHGGSRPLDIFYRMKLAIKGSAMPSAPDKVKDEDLWHIVAYVLSLPQKK